MSDSREYLCSGCGRFLFRARGPFAPIELFFNCPERRCPTANRIDLARVQAVSDSDRHKWATVRRRWRTDRQERHAAAVA